MTAAERGQDVSTTGRHIPALDGLRGLAILLVLTDHLFWSNPIGSNRFLTLILSLHSAGWIGVDLFFVLSGFLITGILFDSLPSAHFFRNFYARRSLRIFPLYYGFLFVLIAAGWLAGYRWHASTFRLLTYTQDIGLQGVTPYTDAPWFSINHFWSLAIEEQFYLVWPPLLFLLRKPRHIALAALLGALGSLGVRLLFWHTSYAAANPYLLYSWTPAHLDGLFTGALLAIGLRIRIYAQIFRLSRPVLVVASIVLAALYLRYPGLQIPYFPVIMVWAPSLLAVLFASLLVRSLVPGTRTQRLCSIPFFRFFGRYSYGLYMFHPVLGVFTLLPVPPVAAGAWSVPRCRRVRRRAPYPCHQRIAVAWCSFHFFERPILRLKGRFHDDSPRPKLSQLVAEETETAVPVAQ